MLNDLLTTKSEYGEEVQEGIYIRFESEDEVVYRVKLRRDTFVAGRKNFNTHIVKNKLKD